MKKAVKILLISVIALFVVYNITWLFYYSKFNKFKDAVGETDQYGNYLSTTEDGQYAYAVYPPKYLRFNGNLAISPIHDVSKSKVTYVTLLVWPHLFSGYKVGVMMDIIEDSQFNEETGEYRVKSHRLEYEVDEKLNPLNDYDEKYWSEFENNKEFIESYCNMAYDKWGILKQS